MSPRGIARAIPAGLLVCAVGLHAAPPDDPPGQNKLKLTVRQQVVLEPITVAELLGGGSTTVVFDGTDPGFTFFTVTREVPDLWQVKMPPPQSDTGFQVNYYLVGANGIDDRLSLPGAPTSMIGVVLEEIPPVSIGGPPGARIYEGGVRFLLDPNLAQVAGPYAGTLTVEVNQL